MDQSWIIGIGLIIVGLVIVAAMMGLFLILGAYKLRSFFKAKAAAQSGAVAKAKLEKPAGAPAAISEKPDVANSTPSMSGPPPVPAELVGKAPVSYFDDDSTAVVMAAPKTTEGAKTELFQRGAHSFTWDEDSEEDEGGATEVFSAHHMEQEEGGFNIED